jgi:hypothetical protein
LDNEKVGPDPKECMRNANSKLVSGVTMLSVILEPVPVVLTGNKFEGYWHTHGTLITMFSKLISNQLKAEGLEPLKEEEIDKYLRNLVVPGMINGADLTIRVDEHSTNNIYKAIRILTKRCEISEAEIFVSGSVERLHEMGLLYKARAVHCGTEELSEFISSRVSNIDLSEVPSNKKIEAPHFYYSFADGVRLLTPDSLSVILTYEDPLLIKSVLNKITSNFKQNISKTGFDMDFLLVDHRNYQRLSYKSNDSEQLRKALIDINKNASFLKIDKLKDVLSSFITDYRSQLPSLLRFADFHNLEWLRLMYSYIRGYNPGTGFQNLLKAHLNYFPGWIAGHLNDQSELEAGVYHQQDLKKYIPFGGSGSEINYTLNVENRVFNVESRIRVGEVSALQRIVEPATNKVFELIPVDGNANPVVEAIIQALQLEHQLPNIESINIAEVIGKFVERNAVLPRMLLDENPDLDPVRYFVSVSTDKSDYQTFLVELMSHYSKYVSENSSNPFLAVKVYTQAQSDVYSAMLQYFNMPNAQGLYSVLPEREVKVETPEIYDIPVIDSKGKQTPALIRKFIIGQPIREDDSLSGDFYESQVYYNISAFVEASVIELFSGRRRVCQYDLIRNINSKNKFHMVELDTAFYPDELRGDLLTKTLDDYYPLCAVYPAEIFAALGALKLDDQLQKLERYLRKEFSGSFLRLKAFYKDLNYEDLTEEADFKQLSKFFSKKNVNLLVSNPTQHEFLKCLAVCIKRFKSADTVELTEKILKRVYEIRNLHSRVLEGISNKSQQRELLEKVSGIMSLVAIPSAKFSQTKIIKHIQEHLFAEDEHNIDSTKKFERRSCALDIIHIALLLDRLAEINKNPKISIPSIINLFDLSALPLNIHKHDYTGKVVLSDIVRDEFPKAPIPSQKLSNFYSAYRYLVDNEKNGVEYALQLAFIENYKEESKWQKLLHKWSNLAQRLLNLP